MMLETQTTVTGGTQGVLELTYHDDDDGEFVGTIELTVVLVDDTEHALVIENVWLTEGEDAAWVLDAPNAWSWDQAEMVRLAFVTTA
ncbi:hypothetical protein [Paraliomyxa miuraensis]|uniref:hypothetical protein n=1 Tax=Paraliomyxa miuraensis TaxID=376150 RepID=UPI00225060E4|nr:hypothetical protein [Paraliomyxa miuraensis]MCX4246486.1 hypothetical protein [Paraliomyxa miuraensis]